MPSTSPAPPGNRPENCGDKPYDSEGPRHPSESWYMCYWPAECCHHLGHAGPAANASSQKTPSRPSQALWERPLDGPTGRWTWQRECRCQSPLQRPHVLPRCEVWSTTPRRPPGAPSHPSPSQRWDERQMPEERNLPPPVYQVVFPRDWSCSCRLRSREASSWVGLRSHHTLSAEIPTSQRGDTSFWKPPRLPGENGSAHPSDSHHGHRPWQPRMQALADICQCLSATPVGTGRGGPVSMAHEQLSAAPTLLPNQKALHDPMKLRPTSCGKHLGCLLVKTNPTPAAPSSATELQLSLKESSKTPFWALAPWDGPKSCSS